MCLELIDYKIKRHQTNQAIYKDRKLKNARNPSYTRVMTVLAVLSYGDSNLNSELNHVLNPVCAILNSTNINLSKHYTFMQITFISHVNRM